MEAVHFFTVAVFSIFFGFKAESACITLGRSARHLTGKSHHTILDGCGEVEYAVSAAVTAVRSASSGEITTGGVMVLLSAMAFTPFTALIKAFVELRTSSFANSPLMVATPLVTATVTPDTPDIAVFTAVWISASFGPHAVSASATETAAAAMALRARKRGIPHLP